MAAPIRDVIAYDEAALRSAEIRVLGLPRHEAVFYAGPFMVQASGTVPGTWVVEPRRNEYDVAYTAMPARWPPWAKFLTPFGPFREVGGERETRFESLAEAVLSVRTYLTPTGPQEDW